MRKKSRAAKPPARPVKKSAPAAMRPKAARSASAPRPGRGAVPTRAARPEKAVRPARTAGPGKPARALAAAPMFQKIAFTMLAVQDAARARAFYEDVLGLKRGLASPDGVWTEYDLPGGGCLALFRHPDPASAPAPGGASVAFGVADLDA